MITFIVARLAALGLPEPLRKVGAWIVLVVAAAALLASVKALYDRSVVADHLADQAVESIEARDVAAEARATDAVINTTAEKEARDAIQAVPAVDARERLACLRQHRLGRDPIACRRYRGDGEQTRP